METRTQPASSRPTDVSAGAEAGADAALQARIDGEELRTIWANAPVAVLVGSAFAVCLMLYLSGWLPADWLYGWIATKLAVALVRFGQGRIAIRRGPPASALGWRRSTEALLALDGAVWGAVGLRAAGGGEPLAALVAAALACVACVATFGLQTSLRATAAYVLPILLPTAGGLAFRGDGFGWLGGLGLVLLLGVQIATAARSHARFVDAARLQVRALRLAAEREEALQLALRQSAARSQLLGNVSHELRTPLHGILGLARLLRMEPDAAATPRRVELIEAAGRHLSTLVDDLLDVSRFESGRIVLADAVFDAAAELRLACELHELAAREKGLDWRLELGVAEPSWVRGDRARFRQVLHTLFGNAVKFTDRGGISVRFEGGGDDRWLLAVEDTGRGVGEPDRERIFQAFARGESETVRPREGPGLGLGIARELARAMGGDLTLSSVPGRGSRFLFSARLPAAVSPAPPAVAAGDDREPAGPLVLVTEDDDVNAMIAQAWLEHLGARVERARNGLQAVARVCDGGVRPDLVFMDCRMPELDGYEATRRIRAAERERGWPRVPIVALTATVTDHGRALCIDAGMDDFLAKPFTDAQLGRVLRDWVAAAGPRD